MTMSRRRTLLSSLGLALLLALPSMGSAGPGIEVGADAPGFEARDVDGAPVRLEDLRGRVVVLTFRAGAVERVSGKACQSRGPPY